MSEGFSPTGYALFETAIGPIALAWSERGLTGLQLPERDAAETERRLRKRTGFPEKVTPPPAAQAIIDAIQRYAAGGEADFSGVPVDLSEIDDFRLAIYAAARRLGHGETTTYGGLAEAAGHKGLARETGTALGQNPVPIVIPCHRIVAAGGKLGGFSAHGGAAAKQRLLTMESARPQAAPAAQASFAF
jgi:methylated-DNA-[protein]-cysteine S-methyltransferase